MKFECEKKEIVAAVERVIPATSAKPTIPYLSNIYFSAGEKKITLTASDIEVSMKTELQAEVSEEGLLIVNARKFCDIIKANPDGKISIRSDKAKVHISSASAEYEMQMPAQAENMPEWKEVEGDKKVSLEAAVIKDMLKKTGHSISTDSLRYVLNGIYMILEKDRVKMVATDGKRLSYISKPCPGQKKVSATAILPSKTVTILQGMLNEGQVQVTVSQNQVQFKNADTALISRQVDGTFPNYEQVIPKDSEVKITFGAKAFAEAVNRVAVLTDDRETPIKITFAKNKISFYEQDANGNFSSAEIAVKYDGKEYILAYKPSFLIDILKNIDSKEASIFLTAAINPAVIKPENDEDYINVIMPMRS